MKCKLCKKILNNKNKYELCSNCQQIKVGELIERGILKL